MKVWLTYTLNSQLKPSHMKVNVKLSLYGQSSGFITNAAVTFSICSTKGRPSVEVCCSIWWFILSTGFLCELLTYYFNFRALWLLHQRGICWQESHRQMEETGLWESVLSEVHSDTWHQLRNKLHLQSSQEQAWSGKLYLLQPISYASYCQCTLYH